MWLLCPFQQFSNSLRRHFEERHGEGLAATSVKGETASFDSAPSDLGSPPPPEISSEIDVQPCLTMNPAPLSQSGQRTSLSIPLLRVAILQHCVELFSGQACWRRQNDEPLIHFWLPHIQLGIASQNLG